MKKIKTNFYQIAEQFFSVNIFGTFDSEDYLRAIHHLRVDNIPDNYIEINLFETKSSGMLPPMELIHWRNINPYSGELEGFYEEQCAIYNSNEPSILLIQYQKQQINYWVEDFGQLPPNERAAPLRVVLHYWFRNTSKFMCHAAGVSIDDKGVILTGKGGSGKSTSTLVSIFESDLRYAGDDFLLVDSDTCRAFSLYSVAKLNIEQFEKFPHLKKYIVNKEFTPKEKGHIYIDKINPSKMVRDFKIKGILLPTVTGKEYSNISSCTRADAFKALTPSSIWILRADSKSSEKMKKLITQIEPYRLMAGLNLKEIPQQITRFINED